MPRPKIIDPETKRAIETHALSGFARRGYAAVSIREITEAAGVTQPMVYYYFKSKEELYRTLLTQSFEELDRLLADVKTHDGNARERLIEIAKTYFRYYHRNPERVRFLIRAFADDEPVIDRETYIRPRFQEIEDIVVDGQRGGAFGPIDPYEIAVALIGVVRIYVERQMKYGGQILTDERAERIVGLLVDGIAVKGEYVCP